MTKVVINSKRYILLYEIFETSAFRREQNVTIIRYSFSNAIMSSDFKKIHFWFWLFLFTEYTLFKLFYIPALVHSLPHTDMSPQAFNIFIHVDVYILKKSTKKINKQHSMGVSSVVNFRLKHSIYIPK